MEQKRQQLWLLRMLLGWKGTYTDNNIPKIMTKMIQSGNNYPLRKGRELDVSRKTQLS